MAMVIDEIFKNDCHSEIIQMWTQYYHTLTSDLDEAGNDQEEQWVS